MASLWPLFASLPFLLETHGQMTDAICIESYAWAYNSYGQSPCMVAAYLQQQCNSAPVNIPALHQNTLYATLGSNASDSSCQCSSVVYSLISACASCQLGNYVSWPAWSLNCTTVYMNVFPKAISPETDVPVWAYNLNLAKGIAFNVTAARLLAAGTPQSVANERNASPGVSPVVYGAVGAACAFALVLLIGGGVFLWRRRHAYRIGEMVPQKYSPLYETNPAASLYVGNRPHSADYSYKAVSVPSTPPIITEFRHSRHLAPAPSVRSAVSLPSLYGPGDSQEYSPAVESSQGTAHGEHSNIVASGEDVVLSPVRRSPVTPVYRPESSLRSPLEAPPAS